MIFSGPLVNILKPISDVSPAYYIFLIKLNNIRRNNIRKLEKTDILRVKFLDFSFQSLGFTFKGFRVYLRAIVNNSTF